MVYESVFNEFAAVSIEMCFDRFWNSITLMEDSPDTVKLLSKCKLMRLGPELAIPGPLLIWHTKIEIVQSNSIDILTETSFHWANKIKFIYSRKKRLLMKYISKPLFYSGHDDIYEGSSPLSV